MSTQWELFQLQSFAWQAFMVAVGVSGLLVAFLAALKCGRWCEAIGKGHLLPDDEETAHLSESKPLVKQTLQGTVFQREHAAVIEMRTRGRR